MNFYKYQIKAVTIVILMLLAGVGYSQTTVTIPKVCDCPSGPDPSTNGGGIVTSIGGVGCTGSGTINGVMTQGVAVSGVTMTLYANVTKIGTWSMSSTQNGVTFAGSGTFTTLGCQIITLTATGTPTSSGPHTWCTNTTPQGCSTATVQPGSGSIATINCGGATSNGTLTAGTPATGVSSTIPYTGGNGGTHSGQTVASTGVTGLTATLGAGSFANGAGTLNYVITGTPATSGTANFAINIGGQSCTLSMTVAAPAPPSNPLGSGSLAGRICFDIAESNDNTNSCGPLSGRIAQRANFNQSATHTQTYTFTPTGTVSNVRFVYINTNGQVINNLVGGNSGNNISTAVTATASYNTNLSSPNPSSPSTGIALGLTNTNPLTADIYVIYNDGATNNGTDRQLKLTANVKDCACCGAFVAAGVWKEFLCHNLGADFTLDPHNMSQTNAWGLAGAYIQWGRRGPNITGDSRVDWQTAPNDGPNGFAAAPTSTNPNAPAPAGWPTTNLAPDFSWRTATGVKTINDPCPAGYRVPTDAEWNGVFDTNLNTRSVSGTWVSSDTNYGSALHFGPNATTKLLTLPATGFRGGTNGALSNRGYRGNYWSSTESGTSANIVNWRVDSPPTVIYVASAVNPRYSGMNIRCIAE